MDEEVAATLEPENQILATAANVGDPLSLQGGRDRLRRFRACEADVEDGDALEATPREGGCQPGTNRLDLGKLRHEASVASRSLTA